MRRVRGFTYIGLLMLVAILSIVAAASATLGAAMERRAAEEDLLRIGLEFRAAIHSYMAAGGGRYPMSLSDLVLDERFPVPRRHLRQVYTDPLTGKADWGLMQTPDGGIVGIYSLSEEKPIKVAGFPPELAHFENACTYRSWTFALNVSLPVKDVPMTACKGGQAP